jgi:uncharacterized protein
VEALFIDGLHVYPLKGARGISVPDWPVGPLGLAEDRRWMLVGPSGAFLSQRTFPSLARIDVELELPPASQVHGGRVCFTAPGQSPLHLPLPPDAGGWTDVEIWGESVTARTPDPDADRWFSEALGSPCRLVHLPEERFRPVDPLFAPGHRVGFADGFPVLLTTVSALDDLRRRLPPGFPLGMERFRPNVVVGGARDPHAEDQWSEVRCGDVRFRLVKPCARCSVPTVDPERGVFAGPEPIRTLATYRRREGKVFFGQNAVVEGEGRLRVGDLLQAIPR